MGQLLQDLSVLAADANIVLAAFVAALIIVIWDWRVTLAGLVLIQLSVAAMAVGVQGLATQWAIAQTLVMILCTLILALSAVQSASSRTMHQSGNWLLRILILALFYTSWRLFEINVTLPVILPEVSFLFVWLSACALLTLSLTDNPLYTGAALLLWCIPMQVIVATLLPIPGIVVLFGIVELLLALGCSYLILSESFAYAEAPVVPTDITFPTQPLSPVEANRMLPYNELTTLDIPAVKLLSSHPLNTTRTATAINRPLLEDTTERVRQVRERADRTGEHPLVGRRSKRKPSGPRSLG